MAANCSDPNNRYVNCFSASVGIKEVLLKWPDGKTSWVGPAKLIFGGIWTLGGMVEVRWGKQKKVYEREVIDFHVHQ